MTANYELSVVYNSGLTIKDESYLSSLSIFYDHIFLPAETARQTVAIVLTNANRQGAWGVQEAKWAGGPHEHAFDNDLRIWERTYQPLFEEGVISRLDSPDIALLHDGKDNLVRLMNHINKVIFTAPCPHLDPYYQAFSRFLGTDPKNLAPPPPRLVYMDMYFHHRRQDVSLPGIFAIPEHSTGRDVYKSVLAQNTLKYLIPKLSKLEPEQILEIREAVADHREGFSMHLQSLSASVEQGLEGGETLDEISRYAQSIIETRLIPDYREFNRVLDAAEKRHRGKILDIAGRILEIDAPIGSPKFFAQLFRSFGGMFIAEAEEEEARLSNRSQAFYFMRAAERRQWE